jgi:hypothetical protein
MPRLHQQVRQNSPVLQVLLLELPHSVQGGKPVGHWIFLSGFTLCNQTGFDGTKHQLGRVGGANLGQQVVPMARCGLKRNSQLEGNLFRCLTLGTLNPCFTALRKSMPSPLA